MTLTVRLPQRVEQDLAQYCVERKLSKSDAVKLALEGLLRTPPALSPYELGRDLFAAPPETVGEDVARQSKRLLRERFRSSAA